MEEVLEIIRKYIGNDIKEEFYVTGDILHVFISKDSVVELDALNAMAIELTDKGGRPKITMTNNCNATHCAIEFFNNEFPMIEEDLVDKTRSIYKFFKAVLAKHGIKNTELASTYDNGDDVIRIKILNSDNADLLGLYNELIHIPWILSYNYFGDSIAIFTSKSRCYAGYKYHIPQITFQKS